MPLEFAGPATPIAESDLDGAAAELRCEAAVIRAVLEVESRGAPFLPDRRPTILFEAHRFSRRTGGRYDGTHPAISSKKWSRALYRGGAREYDRLHEAIALDRRAALESASWGAFQVMGFNWSDAGFADVEAFVAAHVASAGAHLAAFVRLLRAWGLDAALRERRWADFARRYNGAGYAANRYDERLAEAYARGRGPGAASSLSERADDPPPLGGGGQGGRLRGE